MIKDYISSINNSSYRLPAEYEDHKACWMIWPTRPDVWRNKANPAQKAFADVANTIIKYEPLIMWVKPGYERSAQDLLDPEIRIVPLDNNNAWMRDVGPIFIKNEITGDITAVDFTFNAWGGKTDGLYSQWQADDAIPEILCDKLNINRLRMDGFVLEGGSVHSDGEGTLYTTGSCLLHAGRNPELNKTQIEDILKSYLHVKKILWIPEGIYLDETNGHVDNICHIVAPAKILLSWTDNKQDPQYAMSRAALDYLSSQTDAMGRKIEIIKLPLPSPIIISKEESEGVETHKGTYPRKTGDRLAASYANFYIVNRAVIFPLFNDPMDETARNILQEQFPQRKVQGVPAREILLGGGNIHCITLHQPAGKYE